MIMTAQALSKKKNSLSFWLLIIILIKYEHLNRPISDEPSKIRNIWLIKKFPTKSNRIQSLTSSTTTEIDLAKKEEED